MPQPLSGNSVLLTPVRAGVLFAVSPWCCCVPTSVIPIAASVGEHER